MNAPTPAASDFDAVDPVPPPSAPPVQSPLAQMIMESVVPVQDDRLATIVALAQSLVGLEAKSDELSAELKTVADKAEQIRTTQLPALMLSIGLTEFRMADGRIVKIKPEYYGSVSKDRMPQAVEWLKAHNMAGIVKSQIVIKDFDEETEEVLEQSGIAHTIDSSIHPSTLRAFIKERLEEKDANFPKALFAASCVDKAVVTNK